MRTTIRARANTYGYLADEGVTGNPEGLTDSELRERVLKIVQTRLERRRKEALELYHESAGKGKTTDDLEKVLFSA